MSPGYQYLLDTNIISELVRNPHGRVRDRIVQVGEQAVCTSIIVSSELRFAAAKKRSKRLSSQLETILSAIEILPLEEPADRHYTSLRRYLEEIGTPIGPNDMLIAAQAISLGLILITANFREFCQE